VAATLYGGVALPFVIPTRISCHAALAREVHQRLQVAKESGGSGGICRQPLADTTWKRHSPLCHPDRSVA
jgi:hypothetical protein